MLSCLCSYCDQSMILVMHNDIYINDDTCRSDVHCRLNIFVTFHSQSFARWKASSGLNTVDVCGFRCINIYYSFSLTPTCPPFCSICNHCLLSIVITMWSANIAVQGGAFRTSSVWSHPILPWIGKGLVQILGVDRRLWISLFAQRTPYHCLTV